MTLCNMTRCSIALIALYCIFNGTVSAAKEVTADGTFTCADGNTVIPEHKLCNGIDECRDIFSSDECNCQNLNDTTRSLCEKWAIFQSIFPRNNNDSFEHQKDMNDILGCIMRGELVNCSDNPDTLNCGTPGFCVTKASFCDGRKCCLDGADEQHIGFGIKCHTQGAAVVDKCLLPSTYLDDDENQCVKEGENCFLDNIGKIRKHCFRCMDGNHVILLDQVCDGVLDCSDFSDECLCDPIQTPEICRIIYEEDILIEEECRSSTGAVSCGNGFCIPKSFVCNGRNDCPNAVDEIYCYTDKYRLKLDAFMKEKRRLNCNVTNITENKLEGREAVLCDGVPECNDMEDECAEECRQGSQSLPAYCEKDLRCVPGSFVCNGVMESQTLQKCNFTYIRGEEEDCPQRYYCQPKDGEMMSIDKFRVCDGVLDCEDGSDEAEERNCTSDKRFYCKTNQTSSFTNAIGNYHTFVPRYKVKDGIFDCKDASDECPDDIERSHVTRSKQEMILWVPLRVSIWIFGITALVGNLIVAIYLIFKTRHIQILLSKASVAAVCHHILILNLSVADLLMGIYLISGAIQSTRYSGHYCLEDSQWRLGKTCTALGVIVVVSSNMSVYIMLVMAVLRYYTIKSPLHSKLSENLLMKVRITVICGWIFFISYSLLPLIDRIDEQYVTSIYIERPIFTDYKIKKENLMALAKRIETASDRGYLTLEESFSSNSLGDAKKIITHIFPQIGEISWAGYYGKFSICLPALFRTEIIETSNGWVYSAVHVCYKLIASSVTGVLYFLIAREARSSRNAFEENLPSKAHERRLMKRITRIVITNVICVIPISVIASIYIAGIEVSPLAFAVGAFVLAPINSALNPILYSGIWDIISDAFQSVRKKSRPNSSSKSSSQLSNRKQLINANTSPH